MFSRSGASARSPSAPRESSVLFLLSRGSRQRQDENRTLSVPPHCAKIAAHASGQVAADREPESRTLTWRRQRTLELDEWLEDHLQLLHRNARSAVPHLDGCMLGAGLLREPHLHLTARRRELGRVSEQVGEDLNQLLSIRRDKDLRAPLPFGETRNE